jgi:ferredoxin
MMNWCHVLAGRDRPAWHDLRKVILMAHIVTEPCNDCKYTDCCVVCPVECFYQDEKMLYINPDDCIDCEACVPECPVEAIYGDGNVPKQWESYITLNKERSMALASSGHITEKQDPVEGPDCKKK